jgi:hypothetical protein
MPGHRLAGELVPAVAREARDEHVVLAGELPNDRHDLRGVLTGSEHDLRKAEAANAVEVEHEVGGHASDCIGEEGARRGVGEKGGARAAGAKIGGRTRADARYGWGTRLR